jgi:hypothetical protein
VPALPKSSGAAGSSSAPLPVPWITQLSPCLSIWAPIAFIASPVRITSSPSSRPVMRVVPEASPPNMKERCEIDLSPGIRTVPVSAGDVRAVAGCGGVSFDMVCLGCGEPGGGCRLICAAVS